MTQEEKIEQAWKALAPEERVEIKRSVAYDGGTKEDILADAKWHAYMDTDAGRADAAEAKAYAQKKQQELKRAVYPCTECGRHCLDSGCRRSGGYVICLVCFDLEQEALRQ